MNPPTGQADDYLNFLIATLRQAGATEAARSQSGQVEKGTEFFTIVLIEACARRTEFVGCTSKFTGCPGVILSGRRRMGKSTILCN